MSRVGRCLLAPPLYDASEWRVQPLLSNKNQTGYSGVSAVHGTSRYKAYYGKRMSTDGKLLPNHLGCFATAARIVTLASVANS